QAADRRPASQSEVAGGADGAEAPHAHAGARAASLALQCAARTRCLLRAAEQLATSGSLSRCGAAPLVSDTTPAESTPTDLGAIQRVASTLPIAFDPHHSPARGFLGPRWVTF